MLPDVRLVHVGGIGDAPFPNHDRIAHFDPVPQWQLKDFYARAHGFVIASREEGLALVQAQALATGLPIVCTDRTGGADLGHTPALGERIRTVPHDDPPALAAAIAAMVARAKAPGGLAPIAETDRQFLSWRGYGQRYAAELTGERASLIAVEPTAAQPR
jgi:glycosyltransferase involved in cell wall biosynthesis